ncbi:MAG: phosphotransferase [Acidimicrobiales bacterium]|nr:phosphotransferase [Acidimicrobiales bacterium]
MKTNRAAWAELLDLQGNERVAVFSPDPASIRNRLKDRVAELVTLDAAHTSEKGWDLLILDGPARSTDLKACWSTVRPGGRIVLVVDNPRSPLRALNPLMGKPLGTSYGRYGRVRRRLEAAGCPNVQTFALLRSSQSSPTAFRTDLPAIASIVLSSAMSTAGRGRRTAIALLRSFAKRGRSRGLAPAWMVVASDQPLLDRPTTPTGRIGVEHNDQGAVVLGTGPYGVEKFYRDPAHLAATRATLEMLENIRFRLAPVVIAQPAPNRLQLKWTPGQDIDGFKMRPHELRRWLDRAGFVLGTLQRLSYDESGTVLVHGDFWLGATLRNGDEISGVIDWDHCHRGDPRTDMLTLTAIASARSDLSATISQRLVEAAHAGHARASGPADARRQARAKAH